MGGSCLLIRSLGPGVFQPVIAAVVPQEQGALGFELLVQLKAEGVGECGAVEDAGAATGHHQGGHRQTELIEQTGRGETAAGCSPLKVPTTVVVTRYRHHHGCTPTPHRAAGDAPPVSVGPVIGLRAGPARRARSEDAPTIGGRAGPERGCWAVGP